MVLTISRRELNEIPKMVCEVILLPLVLIFLCAENWRYPSEYEATRKQWAGNKPRPLPSRRKRRLTLPLAQSSRFSIKISRSTALQSQSTLFTRLPAEIRRKIYMEVLIAGQTHQRIVRRRIAPLLGHIRETRTSPKPLFGDSWWEGVGSHGIQCHCCVREETDGGLLAPLLTCRKLYSEAIDIIYEERVWEIYSADTFLNLCSTILPQRLNAIRRLRLKWLVPGTGRGEVQDSEDSTWKEMCRILARMQGLQELLVALEVAHSVIYNAEVERDLLRPLMKITCPNNFIVTIHWYSDPDLASSLGQTPFRFMRPNVDVGSIESDHMT